MEDRGFALRLLAIKSSTPPSEGGMEGVDMYIYFTTWSAVNHRNDVARARFKYLRGAEVF